LRLVFGLKLFEDIIIKIASQDLIVQFFVQDFQPENQLAFNLPCKAAKHPGSSPGDEAFINNNII